MHDRQIPARPLRVSARLLRSPRSKAAGRRNSSDDACPGKQNGSRCRHRPPLVPGPNCRAGEGLASFLGGSNAFGASSSGIRGSGRGLATPVGSLRASAGRTRHLPVCGSFGRSFRFRMDLRRNWDRLAPHASSSKILPSLPWLAIRRSPPASAVVAFPSFLPLREVRSSSRRATMTRHPESRQVESGPFRLWITRITRISGRIAPIFPAGPQFGV
jgi:hypothetical protein